MQTKPTVFLFSEMETLRSKTAEELAMMTKIVLHSLGYGIFGALVAVFN